MAAPSSTLQVIVNTRALPGANPEAFVFPLVLLNTLANTSLDPPVKRSQRYGGILIVDPILGKAVPDDESARHALRETVHCQRPGA